MAEIRDCWAPKVFNQDWFSWKFLRVNFKEARILNSLSWETEWVPEQDSPLSYSVLSQSLSLFLSLCLLSLSSSPPSAHPNPLQAPLLSPFVAARDCVH